MASEIREASAKPRILIITGDGLNCERETAWAFTLAGADPHLVHITDILNREKRLADYAALAFIGGFSNGDHLGAGTVQASRFRHALREDLQRFIGENKPVIGICNGFQTIVKMGVLPGASEDEDSWTRSATITANDSGKFEDRWVHLEVNPASPCIWTRGLKRLFLPVRHGEGKFYMGEDRLLDRVERNDQVVARYATPEGSPTQEYPFNPNGSQRAIAAVCDATGLIFGLMPHPEGYLSACNHPSWTRETALGRPMPQEGEGLAIFRNAVEYIRGDSGGRGKA
jgi:phosphoribosylformylglycinamidine synthase I